MKQGVLRGTSRVFSRVSTQGGSAQGVLSDSLRALQRTLPARHTCICRRHTRPALTTRRIGAICHVTVLLVTA